MKIGKIHVLSGILALAICAVPLRGALRRPFVSAVQNIRGRKTVAERVEQYGPAVRERLAPHFERIGVSYPPESMILVGLKHEKRLEIWVSDPPQLLKTVPILGASGVLGPKLRQGDRQVPEGLYRIESLNPNSLHHLALRVNYPSEQDRARAGLEGRDNLGGDIMIHGGNTSIGCLAVGDETIEELFVLAAETGLENISVILSPVDFRTRDLPEAMPEVPEWTLGLYDAIRGELGRVGGGG